LNSYSKRAIEAIQNWCNTLPRKILGYLTPDEAFEEEVMQLSIKSTSKYYSDKTSSICYCNSRKIKKSSKGLEFN
jgi:hypothetical protein